MFYTLLIEERNRWQFDDLRFSKNKEFSVLVLYLSGQFPVPCLSAVFMTTMLHNHVPGNFYSDFSKLALPFGFLLQ